MTLEEVKAYLRIDEDADDAILEMMMQATEGYIKSSVGAFDPENYRVRMLYFLIMQDFYENRVLIVKESDKQRLAHVVGSIVLQLQAEELQKEDPEWTSENSISESHS
ncbi:head-tail connector protein [Zhenpiania hominis]|uniref:Phage head-tail connector protein n=1 Tax=Zhenpiania hominis TaxID=2763644 RepID=A0A923NNN7_9FIRM|nr:phage head-tail connector protein [Zhenpiania hominis]